MGFFEKLRVSGAGVGTIADLATIGAFGIAFYALFNPGFVSNYLSEVADNTRKSLAVQEYIEEDTSNISSSTQALASEIPFWIFVTGTIYSRDDAVTSIYYENPSSFSILELRTKVFVGDQLVYEDTGIAVPSRENAEIKASSPEMPTKICFSGKSSRSGRNVYEYRAIRPAEEPGEYGVVSMLLTDHRQTLDEPSPECS